MWAAERIVQHYYPNLNNRDTVFDIGTGQGRFLMALPDEVKAYGFELDHDLANEARANTGRQIIEGDFSTIDFPAKPTLFIGNPPFEMKLVNKLLDRAYEELDYNQEAGFLLPVYFFQTAETVMRYAKKWSLHHDLMPRNMFHGLIKPLMFARFVKERRVVLSGMFLYEETADMLSLDKNYRFLFLGNKSSCHLWGEVVEKALANLGGSATLQEIYEEIEGKRPTKTIHWKAQIRKVCQQLYRKIAPATYALHEAPDGHLSLRL
jgi:site-specific DNA-methyltransferase (adenine-specific)